MPPSEAEERAIANIETQILQNAVSHVEDLRTIDKQLLSNMVQNCNQMTQSMINANEYRIKHLYSIDPREALSINEAQLTKEEIVALKALAQEVISKNTESEG